MALEHKAFTNKFADLVAGLQYSIQAISDECLEKLITEETYQAILHLNKTPGDKARLLLDNVGTTIRKDPTTFNIFLKVLSKFDEHSKVNLEQELVDLKNRAQIDNPRDELHREFHSIEYSKPHESYKKPEEATKESQQTSEISGVNNTDNAEVHCNCKDTIPQQISESSVANSNNVGAYSIEEIQTTPSSMAFQRVSDARRHDSKGDSHIEDSIECIKIVMEKLNFANLDMKEKKSELRTLKGQIEELKVENVRLKEEKETLMRTLDHLTDSLNKKEENIAQLEKNLSETEKQRYEALRQRKQSQTQVENIKLLNSSLITDVEELKKDLESVQKLYNEVDKKTKEYDVLEAKYDQMYAELTEEVCREQDISLQLHNMYEDDQRRRSKLYKKVCILISVPLIVFLLAFIAFAICLEDSENNNIKKCLKNAYVVRLIIEYLSRS